LASEGKSVREIGLEVGLSKDTVSRYGRRSGYRPRTRTVPEERFPNGVRDKPMIPDREVDCLRYTLPDISEGQRRVDEERIDDVVRDTVMIFGRTGLTVPEIRVLCLLTIYRTLRMTDISTMSGMTSVTTVDACESLKREGLAEIRYGKGFGIGKPYRVVSLKGGVGILFDVLEERVAEEQRMISELKELLGDGS